LWEADLPASGLSTPPVYEVDGKQFVVIACGGGKLKKPSCDAYVALLYRIRFTVNEAKRGIFI
jgi:quinoprotein glucose dehydrogenase